MIIIVTFASQANFLDPQLTSDGKLYAPLRFEQIIEERYQISKHTHTSYADLGSITPVERRYLLEFIKRDLEHENEIIQKQREQKYI